MRWFIILLGAMTAGCSRPAETVTVSPNAKPYIETKLGDFDVTLLNSNAKCMMTYSSVQHGRPINGEIQLDMEAPCNFVHVGDQLQSYEFGTKPLKYKIFLAVGGKPEVPIVRRDKFFPDGCGDSLQKILVYHDRIRVEYPAVKGGVNCPSDPADEVIFAA